MSPADPLDELSLPGKKSGSLYDDTFKGEDPDDIDPYEDIQDAAADDEDPLAPGDDWHPLNEKLQKKDKKKGSDGTKKDTKGADDDDSDGDDDSDDSDDYAAEDKKSATPKDKKTSDKKPDDGYEDQDDPDAGGDDDYAYADSDAASKKAASSDEKKKTSSDGSVAKRPSPKKGSDSDADDPADSDDSDADSDSPKKKSSPKDSSDDSDAAANDDSDADDYAGASKAKSSPKNAAQSSGDDAADGYGDIPSTKKGGGGTSEKSGSTTQKKPLSVSSAPKGQSAKDDPYAGDAAYAAGDDEDPSAGGDQDAYEDAPTEPSKATDDKSRKATKRQDGNHPTKKGQEDPYAEQDSDADPTSAGGAQDPSYGDDPQAGGRQEKRAGGGASDAEEDGADAAANDYDSTDSGDYGEEPPKPSPKQRSESASKKKDDLFEDAPKDDRSAYDPDMVGEQAPPISKHKQDCCETGECAPCGTQDSSVEDDLQDQADQLEQPAKMYDKLKKAHEEVDGYNKILANPHQIFRDPDLLHTAKNDPDNLDKHFRKMGRATNTAPPPDPEDMANDPEYMETIRKDHRTAARHVQDLGRQYGLSVIEMPLHEMNSHVENLHNQYDPDKEYEDPTQASSASYGADPYGDSSAYGDGGDPYGDYQQQQKQQPPRQQSSAQGGFEQLQQYGDADYADGSPPQETDMYGPSPGQQRPIGRGGPSAQNYSYGGDTGYPPENDSYGPGPYGGYSGTHHNEKLSRSLQVLSSDDHDIDPETEGKIRRSISNIQHFQDDPEAFEQDVVRRSDASGTVIAGMRPSEMNQLYYKVKGIARQNQVENNVFIPDPIRPDSGVPYNDKVRAQQGLQEYGDSSYPEENFYGTPYLAPNTNQYGPQYSSAQNFYNRDNRYNVEDPYSAPMQRQIDYQGPAGRMSPDPYGPGPAGMGAPDGDPYGIGASGMGPANLQSFNAVQSNSSPKGNKALALSEMSAFLNDQPQPAGAANISAEAYGTYGAADSDDGSGSDDGSTDAASSTSNKSNWDQFKDDPMGFAMGKGMDLATKGLAKIGLTPDDAMKIAGAVSSVMGAVDKVKGTYGKIKNVLGALSGGGMPLSLCAVADAVTSGDIINKVSGAIDAAKSVYNDAKKFVNDGKSLIHGLMNGKGFKGKLLALASGVGQMADDVSQGADDVNKIYNIATGYDDKGSGSASGDDSDGSDGGEGGDDGGDDASSDESSDGASGNLASDGQGQFSELSDSSGYAPSVSEDTQNAQTFGEMEY